MKSSHDPKASLMTLKLLSADDVVTGLVISISKQEYMFGYKAPFVAVIVSERAF